MISIRGVRLLDRIASGASATVYRAWQEDLGRHVAVKVLKPGLFAEADLKARFLREAKTQAGLNHPNLLALFDAGFSGSSPYLVMELADGGNLREAAGSGKPVPPADVARVGRAVAAGLAFAHASGIVHRDLKPENVLLTRDSQLKIADFGLAKPSTAEATRLTASGMILGTPGYLAPETIRGGDVGPAADVYALGVMLCELALGKRLFTGKNASEMLKAQLDATPETLSARSAALPRGLVQLLTACLDQDPSARPSATEVERRLAAPESFAEAAATRAVSIQRPAPGKDKKRTVPDARAMPPLKPTLVSAASPGRSKSRLAAVAIVSAALAAGAFSLLRAPPKTESLHPKTPRAPSNPKMDAAVSGATVTAGLDRAHVRLGGQAPPGLQLVLSPSGGGRPRRRPFVAGTSDLLLTDLEPDTAFRAELTGSGEPRTLGFHTLSAGKVPGSLRLAPLAEKMADRLGLAADGDRIAVAWACLPSRSAKEGVVELRASDDGGSTWQAPVVLGTAPDIWSLSLTRVDNGFVVAWRQVRDTGPVAVLRFKPDSSAQWSDPLSAPCLEPGPAICRGEPGRFELVLAALRPQAAHPVLTWQELPLGANHAGGGASGPELPRFELEPKDPALPRNNDLGEGVERMGLRPSDMRWLKLVRSAGRRVLFASSRTSAKGIVYQASSTKEPARGAWGPWQTVTEPLGGSLVPDVLSSADEVVVGYVSELGLRAALSRDGGLSFRAFNPPVEGFYAQAYPVLATAGKNLLLGSLYWSIYDLSGTSLRFFGTLDRRSWSMLPLAAPVHPSVHTAALLRREGDRLLYVQRTYVEGVVFQAIPLGKLR